MSEFLNDKDYNEYFRKVERELKDPPPPREKRPRLSAAERKKRQIRLWCVIGAALLVIAAVLAGIVFGVIALVRSLSEKDTPSAGVQQVAQDVPEPAAETAAPVQALWERTDQTVKFDGKFKCKNGIVIDLTTRQIVAARRENQRVSPASTTKVMTALVATELITDYNDTFTMTQKIADDTYMAQATNAGFAVGEKVTMTDLLYGCILPSGADATIALTEALCGSEQAFVQKMNEKAAALGLENTHFTNACGLYDKDHYSTVADMAVITEAALQNPLLKKIMSTVDYTTASTKKHPDGIPLTGTLFSYMYGTEPKGATILAGKTGFVNESGYCFTTYGETDGGKPYLLVVFGGRGRWKSVFELIDLYSAYVKD